MPYLLLCIPILSTLAGGLLTMRLRRHIGVLIAVGAGILLGAAFLDLLPEAIELGASSALTSMDVLALTLLSFLLFWLLGSGVEALGRRLPERSRMSSMLRGTGAGMLIFHSFRDGMAIGVAYTASHQAGAAVALGIAAHDLGDGMNSVLLTSRDARPRPGTYVVLILDAVAPFLGGLLTAWWKPGQQGSVLLLVLAAGFFLQMATSDFLPEVWRMGRARRYLLPSVLLGAAAIYCANLMIGRMH